MRRGRRISKLGHGGNHTRFGWSVWLGLLLLLALPSALGLASAGPVWGPGIELTLPADAAAGTDVTLNSVSCPSAGNCVAVGQYLDDAGNYQPLVVTESSGMWAAGVAVHLPGNADTDSQEAALDSVSCASAGNCSAVGSYGDASGNGLALVVTETSGTWGSAVEASLPANAVLDGSQDAALDSVSCASAGDCSAVGSYVDGSGNTRGLVANEAGGGWGGGVEASLPADAAASPSVDLNSVSCASAGNCSAVGDYLDGASNILALALTETSGTWGQGVEASLPANAAGGGSQDASLTDVSCGSEGNCSAVGVYVDSSTSNQGLLVNEISGAWSGGAEAQLPANAAASSQDAAVNSVSCASAGSCSAVGDYVDGSGNGVPLVVTESSASWGQAAQASLPADATNDGSQAASFDSVSCASAGNCSAVGYYVDGSGNGLALAATESSGSWAQGLAVGLPANAAGGGSQDASLDSVSCASAVECSAVGDYGDASGNGPGLLASSAAPPTPGQSSDGAPVQGVVTVNGVPLTGTTQIPFGAVIDATLGTISITTAVGGTTQTASFSQGVFVLTQAKNGVTTATLTGEKTSLCTVSASRHSAAFTNKKPPKKSKKPKKGKKPPKKSKKPKKGKHSKSKSKTILDKVVVSGHGKFQSKGKYAAAAAHGTRWLLEDRCDGTYIYVYSDVVTIQDFVHHKTIQVTAGHSYFVPAP